jgi:hypothetical protein
LFCLLEGERDGGAEELEGLPLGGGGDVSWSKVAALARMVLRVRVARWASSPW